VYDLAIVNATVVSDGKTQHVDVGISGGLVAGVAPHGKLDPAKEVIDATGLHAFPGTVDAHFHCRAPSHPERGTFNSETRAAAAGGVTTVLEMPISDPPCSTPEVLLARKELGEAECHVDFGLFAGGGLDSVAHAEAMVEAGAIGFKIFTHSPPPARLAEFEGLWTRNEAELYEALKAISTTGHVTTVHAENQSLIELFTRMTEEGDTPSRPPIVEAAEIALVGAIASATGARVHMAHMTSAAAVQALNGARASGADITGETCPHYLIFDQSEIGRHGSYVKVAPPLRPPADLKALWEGLRADEVQMVASDHAPFTPSEKRDAPYATAPQGLPGVEMMMPVMLDAAERGNLSLERAVAVLSEAPARRFGLYPRKGTIQEGADADIVLWDAHEPTTLQVESFVSKAGGAGLPYDGLELKGRIRRTLLRGHTIFLDGNVVGDPLGRFVTSASGARDD